MTYRRNNTEGNPAAAGQRATTTNTNDSSPFGTAVRLAFVLSILGAGVAYALGDLSTAAQNIVVTATIVSAFMASWVLTGRAAHQVSTQPRCNSHSSHRVTLVKANARVHHSAA